MAQGTAHTHTYDVHPNPQWQTHVACTQCGFAVPATALRSRVNLDAIIARDHATPAARARIEGKA